MVRRVLSLSSLCLILWSCGSSPRQTQIAKVTIPDVWVMESDTSFAYNQGVLYFQQRTFSGWQFTLYSNGDTAKIVPFYEGREEGFTKSWYPNHKLAEQRFYEQGKKQGRHQAWWENGQPKFVYQFSNDEHEDVQRVWASNGVLIQKFNYQKGHEEGQQQMWFEDGSLRSNYVIKNGRRFGLPGVKNCVSAIENNAFVNSTKKSIL